MCPVGDGAGQRAGDAGDLLNIAHDTVLQIAHAVRGDAHHDVIRTGDVLGGQHAGQFGELFCDDFGAAHVGLDQHESLDHPMSPLSGCIDSTAQGPNVPQVRPVFSATKSVGRRCHGE